MDTAFVTNTGLGIITNRLKGLGNPEPNYIAWGTGGATVASATQTALTTPAAESRTAGTSSQQTTTTTSDTYSVVGTITCAGSAKAISEVGLFDASSGGNMFMRASFSEINVSIGDSVEFTLKCILDQA